MDIEGEARAILERAGFGLDEVPGARRLVAAILGPRAIRLVAPSAIAGARGELARVNGNDRIYLSNRLSPIEAAFTALHELAHYALGARGHGSPELEAACDAIAGALMCPRTAYRRAVGRQGAAFVDLARVFGSSQTCVALRFGEVLGRPIAVVSPSLVRVRGDDWGWPPEQQIRALGVRGVPELERVDLTDARRRFAMMAA